jgi:hypothetical protein
MSNELSLPQNGLRVGNQLVAEGDNLSLGYNVGVVNDLRVGNTVYANRVANPFVTVNHAFNDRNVTIDCNYQTHNVILNANATGLTFTNVPPARDGTFLITVYFNQDVVGTRTISFASNTNIKWPNTGVSTGNPIYPYLQTIPNRIDVFKFITFDGGSNWIGYPDNPVIPPSYDQLTLVAASPTVVQKRFVSAMPSAHIVTNTATQVDLPLTITITPKFINSRIQVEFFSTMAMGNGGGVLGTMLFRDINGAGYTTLTPRTGGASRYTYGWLYKDTGWDALNLKYFDTPGTLLPVTYKLQYFNHTGTAANYLVHQWQEYGWIVTEITNS